VSGGSALGRRYGRALLDVASEQQKVGPVFQNLVDLTSTWDSSEELRAIFENPSFGAEARKTVLQAIGQQLELDPIVIRSLELLSDRRRMRFLPDVVLAYRDLAEEREGRVRAEVVTASPMPESYFAELQRMLEKVTGKKVILLKREDASLIGGVVTRVGDKVYDGSVRTRLAELKDELLNR
jgi:F-type H+-transporting ATPase subunit delta